MFFRNFENNQTGTRMPKQMDWTQSQLLNECTHIMSVLGERKIASSAIPHFGKIVPETNVEHPVFPGKHSELVRPKPIIAKCSVDQNERRARSAVLIRHGIPIDLDPFRIRRDWPLRRKIRHLECSNAFVAPRISISNAENVSPRDRAASGKRDNTRQFALSGFRMRSAFADGSLRPRRVILPSHCVRRAAG